MTRLIDLHVSWLRQYAAETHLFDPSANPGTAGRVGQVDGYLQATAAAVLVIDGWSSRAALSDLLARIEAEFPGRLLIDPADRDRWRAHIEEEGLCWGLIGVAGAEALLGSPANFDALADYYERGVRSFQFSADSVLTPTFLHALYDLGAGPTHPICDLAGLSPTAAADALAWFEADAERPRRVIPVVSHGAPDRETARRLRALGGVIGLSVGPPHCTSADRLKAEFEALAALPFEGRPGFEGLAVGTDFLALEGTVPGLDDSESIVGWLTGAFDLPTAEALIRGNAERLLCQVLGL